MGEQPIIDASGLVKRYRTPKREAGFLGGLRTFFSRDYQEITAVDDVSFRVARGELIGYLGPNGAGKSTTIKMLTGILHPTAGQVRVNGIVPHRQRAQNSRAIGAVFGQRSQLLWDLPARDSFELLRRIYGIAPGRYAENLEQFSATLDLGQLLDRPVRTLSLGQRMRCELVAALLHDPLLVYLDEPTIGLDAVAKRRIREFIATVNRERGVTVLLTTHDLGDVEALCQRIIIIDKGRLFYDGDLAAFRRQHARTRRVVVTLERGAGAQSVAQEMAAIGAAADIREDGAICVTFDPQRLAASDVTRQIVNSFPVADLAVEEADLEGIIAETYSQEAPDA